MPLKIIERWNFVIYSSIPRPILTCCQLLTRRSVIVAIIGYVDAIVVLELDYTITV